MCALGELAAMRVGLFGFQDVNVERIWAVAGCRSRYHKESGQIVVGSVVEVDRENLETPGSC